MVTQPTKDGKRKWTWFGVVLEVSRRNMWLTCYRLGDWEREMIVNPRDENTTIVLINQIRLTICSKIRGSEADHSVWPAFDVQRIDKANVTRFSSHNHRMRAFARAEKAHAFQ